MSTTFGGNVIFSAHFFVQIPLINEHLFCKYFVCRLCYKALLFMDFFILVFILKLKIVLKFKKYLLQCFPNLAQKYQIWFNWLFPCKMFNNSFLNIWLFVCLSEWKISWTARSKFNLDREYFDNMKELPC